MSDLQKIGGFAALLEAIVYVAALAFYLPIIEYPVDPTSTEWLAFLQDNQTSLTIANFIVYVGSGIILVVLAVALYERLKTDSPAFAQVATVFGLIWAGIVIASGMIANIGLASVVRSAVNDPDQAMAVWIAIDSVVEGIGGGYEIVGGLWVLLVSWAALRAGGLPRALNILGLIVGASGILTVYPAEGLIELFGVSQIVWFVWLGITLLKSR